MFSWDDGQCDKEVRKFSRTVGFPIIDNIADYNELLN